MKTISIEKKVASILISFFGFDKHSAKTDAVIEGSEATGLLLGVVQYCY